MAVTSQDFHTIGCVISVDPARKSLGYQGQSSRVNQIVFRDIPGGDNKRDPERENLAVLTIAAQTANVIHIRVMFNGVTRYMPDEGVPRSLSYHVHFII